MGIIKGSSLMLFKGGKSIAHATSHKLTVTGKVTSTSDKDGGLWNNGEITGLSWETTSDNLYTVAEYDSLFKSLVAGTLVDIIFGIPSNYDINGIAAEDTGDDGGWTAPTTSMYQGKALIGTLTATSNAGDNATFNATFTGVGALKPVTT